MGRPRDCLTQLQLKQEDTHVNLISLESFMEVGQQGFFADGIHGRCIPRAHFFLMLEETLTTR